MVPAAPMQVVLVTGMSGAGKSVALNVLEDDGFYCVDNLPAPFVHAVVDRLAAGGQQRVAVSIDARTDDSLAELRDVHASLKARGHEVRAIFLDARDDILVQRYSESRRRHPLALRVRARTGADPSLIEAIALERELLTDVDDLGVAIDTSDLPANALKRWVRETVGALATSGPVLSFVSFGFKSGVPVDADLVFDARCLPNPHYVPELKPLTGLDAPVAEFLARQPSVTHFIDDVERYLRTWLPMYLQEGRSYLTLGIGCTGGQHRSVFIVERLAERFARDGAVLRRHRSMAIRAERH